jgi:predicted permease
MFVRSWDAAVADNAVSLATERARPFVAVSSVRAAAGPDPSLEARTALWLAAVAVMVLVVACANAGNLLLARALRRRRETSIRLALGIGRLRLLGQLISEGLLLSIAAGAAALVFAQLAMAAIAQFLVGGSTPRGTIASDWRTLGAIAGLAVATGIAVGLVPALVARSGDLVRTLRGGVRGGSADGTRARAVLLLVQSTLSVVLLIGAALFVQSLDEVRSMRLGFDSERVLVVSRVQRGAPPDPHAQAGLREQLLRTARSLSSVESAAWVNSTPFLNTSSADLFLPGGGSTSSLGRFSFTATTPDYFATMGTRILRGRGLTPDDRAGAPSVAIVSTSMANVLWPNEDAVGKCFHMRTEAAPCTTVVGVAEDIVQRSITESERYHYYVSIDQYTRTSGNGMVLKLRGDPAREGDSIRRALQQAMPGASYFVTRPFQNVVDDQQRPWRMGARLFLYFGALALAVAAIGLYGVVGYNVAERSHELAVRTALGATRRNILSMVVGQGLRLAAVGAALGLLVALLASRWIQPLLFRQSATDPFTYAAVSAIMVAVAAGASAIPALVAAQADPNAALRAE